MLINQPRGFFRFPAPPPYRESIREALARTSCRMLRWSCWFSLALQTSLAGSLLLWRDRVPSGQLPRFLLLFLALLPVSLAALLISSSAPRRKNFSAKRCFRWEAAYALLLCLWSTCVTLLGQRGSIGLSILSYAAFSTAAFTVLPPAHGLLVFGGNFLCFSMIAALVPGAAEHPELFLHALFIHLLAFLISSALYRSRAAALLDKTVIQEQYRVIMRQNDSLRRLAQTDCLTGMNNRRFLERAVEEGRFSQKRNVAALMVDIDYFKQYNDTYGHVRGDLCLQNLAQTIRDFSARRDGFAVRYGGEEFLLCLFGCTREEALASAEALRAAVEAECFPTPDKPGTHMTVSIGVCAEADWPGGGLPALICRADKALYQAKQKGRNRVEFFDAASHPRAPESQTREPDCPCAPLGRRPAVKK